MMDQITTRTSDAEDVRQAGDDAGDAGAERGAAVDLRDRRDDGEPRDDAPDHDILSLAPDGAETEGDQADKDAGFGKRKFPSRWVFVGVALLVCCLLAWGIYGHWKQSSAASETQDQSANMVPSVRVVAAQSQDAPVDLTLPGETQPFDSANIYARATGYISERKVDIGSRVKTGDLLVHIAAPDLDQQLAQANAQLGQVKAALLQAQSNVTQSEANLNLAKVNLGRAAALVGQGFETLQNRDQLVANQASQSANLDAAKAGVKVADANVEAQQAAIDRLKALTSFEDVKAPFDGVVTVRNVDLGDLVNADTSTGTPMFSVEKEDILRVMVQVPQNSAIGVRDGLEAKITVPQMPGRTFVGEVTRSSSALQSSARTLTVEVDVPNEAGVLRAGLYAYVSLAIPRIHPDIVLPSETLIFDQDGTHVAVVDDDKIKMVPIHIARDFGTSIETDQGPDKDAKVVLNPSASLREGSKVKVEADDKASQNGQGEATPK